PPLCQEESKASRIHNVQFSQMTLSCHYYYIRVHIIVPVTLSLPLCGKRINYVKSQCIQACPNLCREVYPFVRTLRQRHDGTRCLCLPLSLVKRFTISNQYQNFHLVRTYDNYCSGNRKGGSEIIY